MTLPRKAQGDNSLPWRGRRPPTVPTGRRGRYEDTGIFSIRSEPIHSTSDRRPALLYILKSMLVTYSSFLSALLAPPPSATSATPPEWHRQVEWITTLAQNVMAAANDLRPVQVRRTIFSLACDVGADTGTGFCFPLLSSTLRS